MRGLLPSVWLLGAALYTALTLFLSRPVIEDWPLPRQVHETAVTKQPAKSARLVFADEALAVFAPAEPVPPVKFQPKAAWHNEWVQIAGYNTVGRLRPSATSPVLFAYAVGRPLRVIAREDGFVRVQDLGSGQLGWVSEASLAPFTGGYRQREDRVTEPVVAAVAPAATEHEVAATPVAVKAVTPTVVKKVPHPRSPAIVASPRKETVAAAEPAPRGLFRRKRLQHVALGGENSGVAAIMQRALGRF